MCGISGIAHAQRECSVSVDLLREMRDALTHRGPDGAGLITYEGVGLAHRRLSIIDVQGGAQPLANEDSTIWVTFNGEIYNFQRLRGELIARGHQFSTRCDTEVLVHMYEEYGDDFPTRLNGIFAFAIHDRRRGRVLLARDHLGVKPLFYAVQDETLFFGSEVRSVLIGMEERPRISTEALQEYLTFRYICAPRTFVEGVHRLLPGHVAIWQDGHLQLKRYWRPPEPMVPADSVGLDEYVEELDHRLRVAVDRQLMSDVPLGVFCSGGVDSGLVTSYAARTAGDGLASFSFGFVEREWDETSLASDSAERARTTHHVLRTGKDEFLDWMQRLIRLDVEPLSHPNSVALGQLSSLARQSVKVVLTGEGADELFCGYPRYRIAGLQGNLTSLPRGALRALASGLAVVPGHRARKLRELIALDPTDQYLLNSAFVPPEQVERITGRSLNGAFRERRALLAYVATSDAIDTLSRYETLTYLVSALERLDRVSMANGLEARVPLLDIELVEWALALPSGVKVRDGRSKAILKQLGERWLAPQITRGRKSGFGLPLDEWFRSKPFAELMNQLGDANHPATSLFDAAHVRSIRNSHLRGANWGEALWLISNVYLWHDFVASNWTTGAKGSSSSNNTLPIQPVSLPAKSAPATEIPVTERFC